jgi:hypothetical protein
MVHVEIVDLGITLSQPSLDMCDSYITALSCNDFPSQHWGEGHIILYHSDENSRKVVAVSFMAQGIHNHIHLTGVIMNLKIMVLDQLLPHSLMHVQISLSENVLQAPVVGEDMNHIPHKILLSCPQGKDKSSQLEIMHGIVIFITA